MSPWWLSGGLLLALLLLSLISKLFRHWAHAHQYQRTAQWLPRLVLFILMLIYLWLMVDVLGIDPVALVRHIGESPALRRTLRILALLILGYPLLRLGVFHLRRSLTRRASAQVGMVASKAVFYAGIMAMLSVVLFDLGFNLTAVIGAAGVLGIAIGFASQTSLANIISGLFLVGERPFQVGEVIQQGDLIGTVMSIDLLSVKLRTFDNKYVRIPNEQLIKGVITTINRYPIRRLDIRLSVAYKEDVHKVREVLADLANANPLALDEPKPLILFDRFGDSGLEYLFAVWVVREQFLDLKNTLMDEIKVRFDAEGIEIPFPHMSLYAGSASEPLSIRLVDGRAPDNEPSHFPK